MQEIQGLLVGRPGLFQDGRTTVCGLGPPRGHHWLAAHLVPGVGVVLLSPPRTLAICVDHMVCGGSTSKSSWFLCVEGHCVWNLTGLCLENSQALLQRPQWG